MLDANDITPADKGTAAVRLLDRARASAVPEIAVPALAFVLDRHVAELTDEEPYGTDAERTMLAMHAAGESTCRRCRRPLPATSTLIAWARERFLDAAWRDHLWRAS